MDNWTGEGAGHYYAKFVNIKTEKNSLFLRMRYISLAEEIFDECEQICESAVGHKIRKSQVKRALPAPNSKLFRYYTGAATRVFLLLILWRIFLPSKK
jgi:hypothetical protein